MAATMMDRFVATLIVVLPAVLAECVCTGRKGGETTFDFSALLRHVFLQSPLFYAAFLGALLLGCSLVTF